MSNRLDPPRGVSQLGRKNSPLGNPDVSPSNLVEGARSRRQGQRVNIVELPSSRSGRTPGLFFSSVSPSGAPPPPLSSRLADASDSTTPKTAPVRRTASLSRGAADRGIIKNLQSALASPKVSSSSKFGADAQIRARLLRKAKLEKQAAGVQGDALEARKQALTKERDDLLKAKDIQELEAEVRALRGDPPPLAETEPHTDRVQSQTSAEELAKALEALRFPGEEAKADDQTRLESLLRRLKEKRLGDLDQGEMDLLATLLRGGLTSTKVSPTQRTQSTSHSPSMPRSSHPPIGLAEFVKSAVGHTPSDRSVEEFHGQEMAKKMTTVRSKVLTDAVQSMPSFFRFLDKYNFIGSGPYGAAGALLIQQIVAVQTEFEHRADGGRPIVQHYLFQLFRLVDGQNFTDAKLHDFIMEGQARLVDSTTGKDYLKSLDEALFTRAKDKAISNAPLDPDSKSKKDQSSKGGEGNQVKRLKKQLRALQAAQGLPTDGQQPAAASGGKGKDRQKRNKKQQGAAPGGANPAADSE